MSEALATLLTDALPRSAAGYALGFSDEERRHVEPVVGAGVTFVEDADELGAAREVVIAGPAWESVFSGRVDSFEDRLSRLDACLEPGGSLALVLPNAHSLTSMLSAGRPTTETWDFDALAYDEYRPADPRSLRAALSRHGHFAVNVHEIYGGAQGWCVLGEEAAAQAQRSDVVVGAVAQALEAGTRDLMLPAEVLVRRLAAAGALETAATAFVALVGGRGRAVYLDAGESVEWFDGSGEDSRWAVGGTRADAERPVDVPVTRSIQTQLLAAVAAGNTATFRHLAETLGAWVSTTPQLDGHDDLDLRAVLLDGSQPTLVPSMASRVARAAASDAVESNRTLVLTRAWRRFVTRVRLLEPDMPWPSTLSDHELLGIWLSMSGVGEDEIGGLLEATVDDGHSTSARDGLSTLWELGESSERIVALEDEISALHATLAERDDELAVRARVIRSLRRQMLSASQNRDRMAQANEDIKNSAAFRLANQFRRAALITRPKKLAVSVGKAADKRVRALRSAG